MNTQSVNNTADAISRAMQKGRTLPASLAVALDKEGLLQTSETEAELERLRARVAELEAERRVTNEALDDAVQALRARETDRSVDNPTPDLREEDDPGRCLEVHPFSPRDGWRMVCGNCDHGKDAPCHRGGTE
jgi:hypothetical protein